ncbi:MAG: hypothetical protein ACLFQU_01650 [Candidatus Kapaibacterium sp.]
MPPLQGFLLNYLRLFYTNITPSGLVAVYPDNCGIPFEIAVFTTICFLPLTVETHYNASAGSQSRFRTMGCERGSMQVSNCTGGGACIHPVYKQ